MLTNERGQTLVVIIFNEKRDFIVSSTGFFILPLSNIDTLYGQL